MYKNSRLGNFQPKNLFWSSSHWLANFEKWTALRGGRKFVSRPEASGGGGLADVRLEQMERHIYENFMGKELRRRRLCVL